MAYVENKRKELKTDYKGDTLEVGKQMHLIPQGKLGLKSNVPKKHNVGIG